MSKRKNRGSAPNLPQETLERARRQAAVERGEIEAAPEVEPTPAIPVEEKPRAAAPIVGPKTISAAQRRAEREVRTRRSKDGVRRVSASNKGSELDAETISELLDNPTIHVSEEELRRDYSYVVADMRSMFTLAAGLIVALVVLAQILPK
jgi:hypothetical protein